MNPYSAEHPVPPERFAGRREQIAAFSRYLSDTLDGNSKNIAVLGGWGIGKTSLLRIFRHLAEQQGCMTTIIELGEGTDSLIGLFETITASLAADAARVRGSDLRVKEFLEGLSLSVRYGPLGVSFSERKKAAPNILKFREDLLSISRRCNAPFLVMLDNAEQLLRIGGSLMELRNTFQTVQAMDGVPCMLVLAGRENLFSGIRSVSEPAARFFWPIKVEPFTCRETEEAVSKPLAQSPVHFTAECIRRIFEVSEGHPYFVQVFAYNLFAARKGDRITAEDLDENFPRMLTFIGKRLFVFLFSQATSNEKRILLAFAAAERATLSNAEIAGICGVKSVNVYLQRLAATDPPMVVRGGRGQYALFHPLFREWLRRLPPSAQEDADL
ncbi:MAG TPA: ATP-binding protein [Methanomicrobiales archaeon]|nr:ATP-binding protein [Methanomicrobiales archaeon]